MKTFKGTKGKWIYNHDNCAIESDTEWFVEPIEEDEGIKTTVASLHGAMGGNDINADLKLICSAPDMLAVLQEIMMCYEEKGQLLSFDVSKVRKVLEETLT